MNVAGRAAAVAPGSADTLAAFAGVYQTHQLPDCAGKPADAGFELSITMDSAGTHPQHAEHGLWMRHPLVLYDGCGSCMSAIPHWQHL